MREDHRVFVHLVAAREAGQVWGQWDNAPLSGRFVTTLWQPGMFLRDDTQVPLDADTPAGTYYLHVGLYKTRSHKRLRTQSVGTQDDHFVIGPITVR